MVYAWQWEISTYGLRTSFLPILHETSMKQLAEASHLTATVTYCCIQTSSYLRS